MSQQSQLHRTHSTQDSVVCNDMIISGDAEHFTQHNKLQ